MRKVIAVLLAAIMCLACFSACNSKEPENTCPLEDGEYTVIFKTDSGMFHVNESLHDKAKLTVKDGKMTAHVTLAGKGIVNLFVGVKADVEKKGAQILEHTEDQVTYDDGYTEIAYGFDIPVPVLDEEFDLAILGGSGRWFDHKVSISSPVEGASVEDGEYSATLTFAGGTGKAKIEENCKLFVKDGKIEAELTWTSKSYDYMIVDEVKYQPKEGTGPSADTNSVFVVVISALDKDIIVIGDTIAMSTPHEIEYTINISSESLTK